MRYTDFLKTTVLLAAAVGTALAAVTIAVVAARDDTRTLYFALGWWLIAAAAGVWLGRRTQTTDSIADLLSQATMTMTLPEIRPAQVLLERLWLLVLVAVAGAGTAWLAAQFAAVASGGALLVALAWRKQERAVTAVEERDGVRFYVVRTSPFQPIKLVKTAGLRRLTSANGRRA